MGKNLEQARDLGKLYDTWHPGRRLNAVGGDNNGEPVHLEDFSSQNREVRDDYNANVNAVIFVPGK